MFKCECCNNLVEGTECKIYKVESEQIVSICDDCKNSEQIFYCSAHNRFELAKEIYRYEVENFGNICEVAYVNDEFYCCDKCNKIYHINDLIEYSSGYICRECDDGLPEYHTHEYTNFLTTENEATNQYYGIELEIECNKDSKVKPITQSIVPIIENEFVLERDYSLKNGFEMISYPFSYDYMMTNLESTLKELYENLESSINKESNTAGMHIHLTRQNYRHAFNMVCLIEYYQRELTILSNREGSRLKRWAKFLTDKFDHDLLSERMIESYYDNKDRYVACNVSNKHTIEIRIFNATDDYKEILGRIEIISNLSEYAKENSIDNFMDMPNFYEIATYKYNSGYGEYVLNKYNLGKKICEVGTF